MAVRIGDEAPDFTAETTFKMLKPYLRTVVQPK